MEKLLKLRDEMKEDLLHGSIFPFWEQYTIDHENGGFYGAVIRLFTMTRPRASC